MNGTWTALSTAAAPVLVARASVESLHHTMRLTARMRALGLADVVDRSVLVVMATVPNPPRQVRAVQMQAGHTIGDLITVPFDSALARPEPIEVRSLRRATRGALVRVAAAVLRRCPADPELVQAHAATAATATSTGSEEAMT
jgi:MinD-like ATPase involved in chromosome partitioning or flagellar assembly